MPPTTRTWDRELLPRRRLMEIPVRELWRYRDLIWLLARRNITAQYKQTVLGPMWFIIQPLLTTVVFSFVFGRMGQVDQTGKVLQTNVEHTPHFLFYMSGLVLFGYFSELVNKTSQTFTRNAQIFGKVYFPRLSMPLAGALTSLAAFAVQFGVFLVGFGYYVIKMHSFPDPQHPIHIDPNWRMVVLPLLLLQITMFGLGAGLIIAALTTRYRDLQMGVGFMVQLWMFCSSVVIPLNGLDERYQQILKLNPLVPAIEGFRFAFLGRGTVTQMDLIVGFTMSAAIFFLGLVLFSRTEQTVMDTV